MGKTIFDVIGNLFKFIFQVILFLLTPFRWLFGRVEYVFSQLSWINIQSNKRSLIKRSTIRKINKSYKINNEI